MSLSLIPRKRCCNSLFKSAAPRIPYKQLIAAGLIGIASGGSLHVLGICPVVKRIWTPTWAVYSSGWTLLLLAAFYGVIDLKGYRRWAFPLVVVGMNSIAMYCMAQLLKPWVKKTLATHFGSGVFNGTYFGTEIFPAIYAPTAESVGVLFFLWLICWWMYRQKVFLRV